MLAQGRGAAARNRRSLASLRGRGTLRADPPQEIAPLLNCPQRHCLGPSHHLPAPKARRRNKVATIGAAALGISCSGYPGLAEPPALFRSHGERRSRPHLRARPGSPGPPPALRARPDPQPPSRRGLAGAGPGPGEPPPCSYLLLGAGEPRCRLPERPGSHGTRPLPRRGRLLPAAPHLPPPANPAGPGRRRGPGQPRPFPPRLR